MLAYEAGETGLDGLLVLAADNPDAAGDFPRDAEEIAGSVLSGKPVRRLFLHQLGSSMTGEIVRAFDEGASLVSYVGHGGIHLWADENVLDVGDVAGLAAQPQQPVLLTMNCLNGYFHFPYFDSLSEELLKAEGRGAIAAFSPSGLSLNGPAHRFHQALLEALFHQGHARLGDAVLEAQEKYAATGAFPELLSIYHLLGDPALLLR
ncbi:MAG: C25 family cysteine peptidase [Vicinamibacteria bacterium]